MPSCLSKSCHRESVLQSVTSRALRAVPRTGHAPCRRAALPGVCEQREEWRLRERKTRRARVQHRRLSQVRGSVVAVAVAAQRGGHTGVDTKAEDAFIAALRA